MRKDVKISGYGLIQVIYWYLLEELKKITKISTRIKSA
jgi:hypothetical protein